MTNDHPSLENLTNTDAIRVTNGKLPRKVSLILWILLAANFVVSLNETVLGVALPVVMKDLHITAATGQWLTTAFLLTMSVVIPITGYLQSKYSTRTLFFAAMGIFTVGTVLGALSIDFAVLLLGRVCQAAGTALLFPMFMTTMMVIVPENMRGRLMGRISLVFAVAPALGPAASGIIVQAFGWHALFWLVLPVAVAAVFIGGKWLHLEHEPGPIRLDFFSLLLSAVGFSSLIYGLSDVGTAVRSGEAGQPAVVNPLYIIIPGALIVTWFVWRQIRLAPQNAALLDFAPFKVPAFRNSMIVMNIMMITLFGTLIIVPIYVQSVLHYNALTTGLMMMPGGLLQGLLGVPAGRMMDKYPPTRILVPAMGGVAVAIGLMAGFSTETPLWLVFVSYSLLSASLAFVFPILMGSSMAAVGPEHYSHASAIVGVTQQVFGAAGTAGFVAVLTLLSGGATAASDAASLNNGTHGAFVIGAVLALVAAVLSFTVRKPPMPAGAPGGHGAPPADGAAVTPEASAPTQ